MLKELAPFQRRPFRTADRSAVNPRGLHCDKEVPIKTRISRHDRLVALIPIQWHAAKLVGNSIVVWPFSDMKIACAKRLALLARKRKHQLLLSLPRSKGWCLRLPTAKRQADFSDCKPPLSCNVQSSSMTSTDTKLIAALPRYLYVT